MNDVDVECTRGADGREERGGDKRVDTAPVRGREARPPTSRIIDRITDALGDEKAFLIAAALVPASLIVGVLTDRLATVASIATLVTFSMVFAVQHTSSRESRALNVKLDELIRVTGARNELIGAEDESHDQLDQRGRELLEQRTASDR